MQSIIRYTGKKDLKYLLNQDLDVIRGSSAYIEVFGGSFNLGFQLINRLVIRFESHKIVYNDLDSRLVKFWMDLAYSPNELFDVIWGLCQTCEIEENKESLRESALEYIFRAKNGLRGYNDDKNVVHKLLYEEANFNFFLQSSYMRKTVIKNLDFKQIIETEGNNPKAFLFLDPPYININNIDRYYRCNSSEFRHEELADVLKDGHLKSKFMLTYNENDKIRKLYEQFNIREYRRSIMGSPYTELIITNY